jgi:hypothetical protein
MSDPNLQNFIDLSATLTGLSADKLAPSVDPINLPPLFFATAQQGMGTVAFSNLLELYASLKSQSDQQIASLKSQAEQEIASLKGQSDQQIASLKSQAEQQTASLKSQLDQQNASAILGHSDQQITQGARSIMKLWLLGSWYQPYDQGNAKEGSIRVVSDQAYKESWAWKIAQSHPMGYSQYHFGYWAEEPPTLKQFTGVDAKEGQQP